MQSETTRCVERRELSSHERVRGALTGFEKARGEAQDAGLVQCRKRLDRGTAGRTLQPEREARRPLAGDHIPT
jgi:hypothetical protein